MTKTSASPGLLKARHGPAAHPSRAGDPVGDRVFLARRFSYTRCRCWRRYRNDLLSRAHLQQRITCPDKVCRRSGNAKLLAAAGWYLRAYRDARFPAPAPGRSAAAFLPFGDHRQAVIRRTIVHQDQFIAVQLLLFNALKDCARISHRRRQPRCSIKALTHKSSILVN